MSWDTLAAAPWDQIAESGRRQSGETDTGQLTVQVCKFPHEASSNRLKLLGGD